MNKILSLLPPPELLFHQVFKNPSIAFLSLVMVTCIILYYAKTIFSRRIFLIIDETKTAFDPHYRNLIEEFCEKYFKVSPRNFKDQLDPNLQIPRNQYNKVVVLSGILRRREDTQTDFYRNLGIVWRDDLIIFYGSSEGNDFSIPELHVAQTAQVSLRSKDYSDKKVTENLENFLKPHLFEEFRGIISASFIAGLLLIIVVFVKFSSSIGSLGEDNHIFEKINQTLPRKNTSETVLDNFDDLAFETPNDYTAYSENLTKQTEGDSPSENFVLRTSERNDTKKERKRGQNRFNSNKEDLYSELGDNDRVWTSERDNWKGKIVNRNSQSNSTESHQGVGGTEENPRDRKRNIERSASKNSKSSKPKQRSVSTNSD